MKVFMLIIVIAAFSRLSYKMNKDPLLTKNDKLGFHGLSLTLIIIFAIIILLL